MLLQKCSFARSISLVIKKDKKDVGLMEKYLTVPSSLLQAFCLAHASSLHHQPAANALFLVTSILTWISVQNMHIDVAIALNRRHIVPTLVSTITQPPSCCYDSPVLVLQKRS